jgi:hypothetical protein
MEHGGEARLAADILGIGAKLLQGAGSGLEEEPIEARAGLARKSGWSSWAQVTTVWK